jgi:hypothetical protein
MSTKKRSNWILWVFLALTPFVFCIGGCGLLGYMGFKALAEPIDRAMELAAASPELAQKIGSPMIRDSGHRINNYNVTNNNGSAEVDFNLKGPTGSAHITGKMVLTAGVWSSENLIAQLSDGTKIPIK